MLSSELRNVDPAGTAPSAGITVAMYGSKLVIVLLYSVNVGSELATTGSS